MFYGQATLAFVTTSAITACGGPPAPTEETLAEQIRAQDDAHLTKLYVFDCGRITLTDASEFSLSTDDSVRTLSRGSPAARAVHF